MLIVECGVKFDRIKKAIDFDLRHVAGILVSHEHGDHAGSVGKARRTSIPVYMSKGTADSDAINLQGGLFGPRILWPGQITTIGEFRVLPFNVKHDAADPLGFLIEHPESGRILFATDTYYLPAKFPGLSNIMIECNYDQEILDKNTAAGLIDQKRRDRTIESHMSVQEVENVMKANDLSGVVNIVLIHLSDTNADADTFRDRIARITGKNVIVAEPGTTINFNKEPF